MNEHNEQIRDWDHRIGDQVKKQWDNYIRRRIDLSIARTNECWCISGEFIYVEKVSSPSALATIRLNKIINDDLELSRGVEIETVFFEIFITNTIQQDEWIDLLIGVNFKYKKKVTDCPQFGIILWPKSISEIPPGWHLCDGTAGTIDLRDRFIVGAGSNYALGATGGSITHQHTISGYTDVDSVHYIVVPGGGYTPVNTYYHWHSIAAGNTSMNGHRPPYYAVYFIQKL